MILLVFVFDVLLNALIHILLFFISPLFFWRKYILINDLFHDTATITFFPN